MAAICYGGKKGEEKTKKARRSAVRRMSYVLIQWVLDKENKTKLFFETLKTPNIPHIAPCISYGIFEEQKQSEEINRAAPIQNKPCL